MQLPLQVTFRHMEPSEALESKIRKRVEELDQLCDTIMSCRVVVEINHQHHHQGNLFHVRVDLKVPGKELVVSRESNQNHAHEDPYVVVRDAFDAMRRQLEDFLRVRRREVKTHDEAPQGIISVVYPHQDYGRITSSDGRDIYFHRNSVVGTDFDSLETGMKVRFAEEMGEKGPQASTVHIVGNHG